MKHSHTCGLLAALLVCFSGMAMGELVTLTLHKCSCGTGNAHTSDTGSDNNITVMLPAPGQYSCLSLKDVGRQNETFSGVSFPISGLPSGTTVTIYNTTTCTQQLETWTLFKSMSPYAIIPGSVNTGNLYSDADTFLSLQIHVPIPDGPIEDGYYQMHSGGSYSDIMNSGLYSDCGNLLSANAHNDSLYFVNADDKAGLQQFQFTLVKSPNQYTISIPRGHKYSPAMLASPACDSSEAVTLVPLANATAETTWVLSNVQQQSSNHNGFGFLANITSLARLQGACAQNNATTLGVQPIPQGPDGYDYSSCGIEDGAYLIPGAEVQFNGNFALQGGWGLVPVSPNYCRYGVQGSCAGYSFFSTDN